MEPSDRASPFSAPHIPFLEGGSYPVRYGNAVKPLADSLPAFRRIDEAIDGAQRSVWVAVTFLAPDFEMPDGRGTVFDVLDRAVSRGLDVRVLFWRPNPESAGYGQAFGGTPDDLALLAARGSRFRARWDRAHGPYCQHQKFWLIDAGHPDETAFVGGINPTFRLFAPGHAGEGQRHDLYVEVSGPAATDVHHNFVQRWNEASERAEANGVWPIEGNDDLPFPDRVSAPRGDIAVQMQRNVYPGRYRNPHPTPGGRPYDIASGERSVLEQYIRAIDAARDYIYIENQALPVPEIAACLESALKRGVEAVLLVPVEPEPHIRAWRRDPERAGFFEPIEALGRYANFGLAGIAGPNGSGGRSGIYVHAKTMLIDDAWATIGSCNLHANSLYGHTELNATFRDPQAATDLRVQLLSEHLAHDTGHLNGREAMRLYRSVARANRLKGTLDGSSWEGLALALDPAAYGE